MAPLAVVFVGPSVTGQDLDRIRRDGRLKVRRPIRRGAVPGVISDGYRLIGIIDGELGRGSAVPPSEILAALGAGCHIVGGAGVGALLAAGLGKHGIEGVGVVCRWQQSGRLTGHEDIAVRYAAVDGRYQVLTVPMANVRWLATVGLKERWLSPPGARRLLAAATATPWSERTWPTLATSAGLTGQERRLLLGYAASPDHDLMRLDALAVIDRIQQILSPSAMARGPGRVSIQPLQPGHRSLCGPASPAPSAAG
jgi:hypothetical protein